ncbi:unnamed protein product [Orchesella dallaii]
MTPSASPWTRFFYISHIFTCFAAVAYILCAHLSSHAEKSTLEEFNLKITATITLLWYIAATFLITASIIGFLAQRLNKPSLWIVFCILMSILAVVEFGLAVSALAKAGSHHSPKNALLAQMDEYVKENTEPAFRWDKLHTTYKCCGVESYKDWQDVQYGRTTLRTPKSCCLPEKRKADPMYCNLNVLPEHDQADEMIYTRGCLEEVMKSVDFHMALMGYIGIVVSLVHFVLVSLSCFLVITKKV